MGFERPEMASSSLSGCPIIDISVVIGVEELIPAIGNIAMGAGLHAQAHVQLSTGLGTVPFH